MPPIQDKSAKAQTTLRRTTHALIVDDDRQIRSMLARYLHDQGLRTTQAADGEAMFAALGKGQFDVILLDIMMPGEDGLSLCRRIRALNETPIILLTAVTADTDRIIGLETGADDYVTKPFNPRELLARIRSVLRRSNALPPGFRRPDAVTVYTFDGWTIDIRKRTLTSPQGALVDLTSGEFDLLHVFVEHPNEVLSRDQLLDLARGRSTIAFDRAIDVQISRLRRKVEPDNQQPTIIKTVRSEGYIMTAAIQKHGDTGTGRIG